MQNEMSEAEALSEWCEEAFFEEEDEIERKPKDYTILKTRYTIARTTKVGDKFECPSCGKIVVKRSYQHTFCRNRGQGNCKDYFWNRVDATRLARAIERS
jgi:predicted RNA-binding Zn-ribbon protein involved in translation (DUF1610 family)